jgi:hypothetical protein
MKRRVIRELIKPIFYLAETQRTQSCLWLFGSNAAATVVDGWSEAEGGVGFIKTFFTAGEKSTIHILITFTTSNIVSNVFRYLLFYIKNLCVLCASARDKMFNIQFATKAAPAS